MRWLSAICLCLVLSVGCSSSSTEKTKTVGLTGNPKVGDPIYTDGKWWKVSEIAVNGDRQMGIGPSYRYCKLVIDEEKASEEK